MTDQIFKINLGTVQETLMIPLWARAEETKKDHPIINDTYAKDIIAKIDYDFSKIKEGQTKSHQIIWPIRAYNFDKCVEEFLKQNAHTLVVNIGAGLDTTFQRIDDGQVLWINLDLPDVAALRQKLIPDSEREITIAKSVFDFTWIDNISQFKENRKVLFMAAGILFYFNATEVETLFCRLADAFPSAHVIFDGMSRLTVWGANKEIIKKSGMDSSTLLKWHIKKASHLKKWVDTLKIIEEFSMFSKVPLNINWSKKMIRDMKIASRMRLYNMIHVQL